jgi:plasmid stabilization system protein ParE
MARTVVFLAEVASDIGEAYWWYEEKDLGLGDEFLRCLEEAFSRISDHPEHFPIRFDDVRRVLVRRFPYAVYFYHDDTNVLITYVFHTLEEVTRNAMHLPAKQRLALTGFLLETEDLSSDTDVDAAWDQEIQERIKAVDSGAVTGISYQDVMLEAEKRLAP